MIIGSEKQSMAPLTLLKPLFINYVKSARGDVSGLSDIKMPKPMNKQGLSFDPDLAWILDCSQPHELFPIARGMNRKIILHVGPTNSGQLIRSMNIVVRLVQTVQATVEEPIPATLWDCTRENVQCSRKIEKS